MGGNGPPGWGELLRHYRGSAGLTQAELAARSGISSRTIQDLERGRVGVPRRSTVALLARALRLSPEERATLEAAGRRPQAGATAVAERPSGLPMPLTPMVDREREVERIGAYLLRTGTRLLTLTGTGGVGKTRLALHAAVAIGPGFADGVVFVPLATVRDPELVLAAIAQAAGVRGAGGRPLQEGLFGVLRAKHLLLVSDNFEHVRAAAPAVAALLLACPRLAVLATSRAAIRVQGEQELPVLPLALPEAGSQPTVADLAGYPAVDLFLQRVRAARPEFTVTAANAAAIAAICLSLDGLPLALELAAARIRVLPPRAMLDRLLGHRMQILVGGERDRPERQQTLRATLAWSYDLLRPGEQALFRRLSVCSGGCTLATAVSLGAETHDGEGEVIDRLAALVDQSLIGQEEQVDGEARYGMLETVREYGLERLAVAGGGEGARRAHAHHFMAEAEAAAAHLPCGPDEILCIDLLEREHDNLRAALDWSLARHEAEIAACIATSLRWFWDAHGHIRVGRHYLDAVLALGDAVPRGLYAKALDGAGMASWRQGEYDRGIALHTEGAAISRALGDNATLALCLADRGAALALMGDFGPAAVDLQESVALARTAGAQVPLIVALVNRGILYMLRGTPVEAIPALGEALTLAQLLNSARGRALSEVVLGLSWLYLGDAEQAEAHLTEALPILRRIDDRIFIMHTLVGYGSIAALRTQTERAARLLGAAEGLRILLSADIPRVFLAGLEPIIASIRAQLGEESFARVWGEGQGMHLEQALDLVQQQS